MKPLHDAYAADYRGRWNSSSIAGAAAACVLLEIRNNPPVASLSLCGVCSPSFQDGAFQGGSFLLAYKIRLFSWLIYWVRMTKCFLVPGSLVHGLSFSWVAVIFDGI